MYGECSQPLAQQPFYLEDPPPGQILLVRPWPIPEDPFWARVQERNTNWLRRQSQNLLGDGDGRTRLEQEFQFSVFTRVLLRQRGFERFWLDPNNVWHERFKNREVIETAEHLFERHRDVRLRFDLATAEWELCGPNIRVRQRSDEVVVSLRPVIDALWMTGLWTERADERFRDVARVMVRLATDEYRRVGRTEFVRRYGQSEQ